MVLNGFLLDFDGVTFFLMDLYGFQLTLMLITSQKCILGGYLKKVSTWEGVILAIGGGILAAGKGLFGRRRGVFWQWEGGILAKPMGISNRKPDTP